MSLIAGIDIGNSTTEIVVTRDGIPVAFDRRPTRGHKGSAASVQAAAALLRSIERQQSVAVDHVVVAPWFPVTTRTATVHEAAPDTGEIQLIANATHSVTGNDSATGTPWTVTDSVPQNVDVIAAVPRHVSFSEAAALINSAIGSGARIRGVVIANDEAVLISARVTSDIPMVDRVDLEVALHAKKLFIEVRPAGFSVTTATDVWALKNALELNDTHNEHLGLIARWVASERAIVIGHFPDRVTPVEVTSTSTVTLGDGRHLDLFECVADIAGIDVGGICEVTLENHISQVTDLWAVDLSAQLRTRGLRVDSHSRSLVLSTLTGSQSLAHENLDLMFGVPVTVGSSEAHAARIGAHSTPGSNTEAVVLDIGGGTIDLIDARSTVSAAGAGDLLTAAVSQCLDVPRGAADWIKRGPAMRVEAPSVVLTETGGRTFVDDLQKIPATLVGSLVADGPSGYLPFGAQLAPAEWRIMRQGLKSAVLGENIARLMRSLDSATSHDVIVVGGPAADDELLPVVAQLSGIGGLGRGNVAGTLGHRYAVAYGLTQMA